MPDLKLQAGMCTDSGESSTPAPPVEIYDANRCHVGFKHTVSHHEDGISAVAEEKCSVEEGNKLHTSYSRWSEESRLPPEWEGWPGPHMNSVLG